MAKKILIIRFSSFGDVLQTLSVVGALHQQIPKSEIHWVTREEFLPLLSLHPGLKKVWPLNRREGFLGLLRLALSLQAEGYDAVYDAHNNLRSRVLAVFVVGFLGWRRWLGQVRFLRRPIYRWRRFLLFRFRINQFEQPFNGQKDLLRPLQKWGLSIEAPPAPQLFLAPALLPVVKKKLAGFNEFVALAPSAAFVLKRWPLEYWRGLIESQTQTNFVVLGGAQDTFLQELLSVAPERVKNLAGQLSLEESAAVVSLAQVLVSNDTGLLHVAEQLGVRCVALMGPAPFGFPSRPLTKIMQLDLPCRPCSKHGQGPCVNPNFHECLRGITVVQVSQTLNQSQREAHESATV